MLFCSSRTVDRWLKRFQAEGIAGLSGRKGVAAPFGWASGGVAVLVSWVTTKTPGDFGFFRTRWCCARRPCCCASEGVGAGRETVRRWLHRGEPRVAEAPAGL